MVRCQRPDKGPTGSYAGAPNKNHSGRSVAKLPNGHKSDDIDHSNHAEPETSNDQQQFLATQECLLPKAQLQSTIFAPIKCHQITILWEILSNGYPQAASEASYNLCTAGSSREQSATLMVSVVKKRLSRDQKSAKIPNSRF